MLSRLDYCNCYPCGFSCHSHCTPPENTKQCSQNQKDEMSNSFSNNNTGFRFKHALTTNLQHLLFDYFGGSLPQCLTSRLDIYQPFRTLTSSNDWASQGSTLETEIFRAQVFQLPRTCVCNSRLADLKFSSSLASFKSKLKDICPRSPIQYAEITVTDVTGHTAMLKRI